MTSRVLGDTEKNVWLICSLVALVALLKGDIDEEIRGQMYKIRSVTDHPLQNVAAQLSVTIVTLLARQVAMEVRDWKESRLTHLLYLCLLLFASCGDEAIFI